MSVNSNSHICRRCVFIGHEYTMYKQDETTMVRVQSLSYLLTLMQVNVHTHTER